MGCVRFAASISFVWCAISSGNASSWPGARDDAITLPRSNSAMSTSRFFFRRSTSAGPVSALTYTAPTIRSRFFDSTGAAARRCSRPFTPQTSSDR